jgi:hypothetical protein
MSRKILVVTSKFHKAEKVKELLPDDDVYGCHRDYHVEGAIESIKPDLIYYDGTCKTRFDFDSESVAIYFNPKPLAKKFGVPVHSLDLFLFVEKFKKMMSMSSVSTAE